MDKIAFFDAKSYDKKWFSRLSPANAELKYIDARLTPDSAVLAEGCDTVCCFVNDDAGAKTLEKLSALGVNYLVLRCAGYNNLDLDAAESLGIRCARVPAYSPSSIAEHAMALLLTLTRKTHRAFIRTRERNFSLEGLEGGDLRGRTVGIVGTGKVGRELARMCRGFSMRVLAYDPCPAWGEGIEYVRLDELMRRSDVISLHCPLTPSSYHMVSRAALASMKKGVIIINTSRGALVDSEALLDAVKSGQVGAAGLDVYEEEADVFYEDVSNKVMSDDTLNLLLSQPNVIVTGHQAFLTDDALKRIAEITWQNIKNLKTQTPTENELKKDEITA